MTAPAIVASEIVPGPEVDPGRRRATAILRQVFSIGAQWRALALWLLIGWIPTALLALPLWRVVAAQLDYSAQSALWAQHFDALMFVDLVDQLALQQDALAGAALLSGLVMLLLLPFIHAFLVTAAAAEVPLPWSELLQVGWRNYGPMLRLQLVALIPLGLAVGLCASGAFWVRKATAHAIVATAVEPWSWLVYGLGGVVFLLAHAMVDAGRAHFGLDPHRRSAVKASWRGLRLVLGHPLASLGRYFAITLVALLVLALLALARLNASSASWSGFTLAWLLVQGMALTIGWMHFCRVRALLLLARARVTTTATIT